MQGQVQALAQLAQLVLPRAQVLQLAAWPHLPLLHRRLHLLLPMVLMPRVSSSLTVAAAAPLLLLLHLLHVR